MKILQIKINKGIVKVLPERLDDLWHLFNIIIEGDEVHARTSREMKVEDHYARPKKGRRIPVLLGIKTQKVSWDKSLNRLRIHGIVCRATEKMNIKGAHHTINVNVGKPITIVKKQWPKYNIVRLKRASISRMPPILVISIDNEEYCVALLRQYGVDVRTKEKTRLPGKLEANKRAIAIIKFYDRALKALNETWMDSPRSPIVIIGPGFMKTEFFKYLKRKAHYVAGAIVDVKGVNSSGAAGIHEALRSGVFTKTLRHVRIANETKVVEEVLERLGKGVQDVTYGFEGVRRASLYGAVAKLLVADITLRNSPHEIRKALERVMKEIEEKGGQTTIISTEHEAGTKLLSLGGVAALLRFPLG